MEIRSFIVGITIGGVSGAALSADVPKYLPKEHARVAKAWLNEHAGLRIATDADCGCDDDLKRERTQSSGAWKAKPSYHPYYVAGDFNQDGTADFAIGVLDSGAPGSFRVVVFNGPFGNGVSPQPAFVSEPRGLGQGMFFGPPRLRPFMLVVGAFESHGASLVPTAKGYELRESQQ